MGGKFAVRATGLWGEMPAGLAPMAKRRFIICEALQAFSAVMAMLGVIEVKYDGARQLKWFKCAAVWHNVIFWHQEGPLPKKQDFFSSLARRLNLHVSGIP